ncbi:unnamed protein product [Parnassius apollo]|uniref:(apollo) hypothetical protein n=1 Tax=Parnassius apollo TaxID=110799 RepID=A0A8S3WLF1_PARAO|nr:unnamed protein product [Parnassius apollo]
MEFKRIIQSLYEKIDTKFFEQFKFHIRDTNFCKITNYMHEPKNAASLAITRILFGVAMLFDIPDERGGAAMVERWGNPSTCHFPLLSFIRAVPMPYMAFVFAGLWYGALGIALGYKFRLSSIMFTVCFWYLLLIEKSYWNNHSYLFGLVGLLLTFTQANCCWSLDAYFDSSQSKQTVPYWNYFILKYQFFILYFMAGLKKGTAEWLTGYSVLNLSEHWVFTPFKLFLTVPQTDYLIVHWFVFVFDLTVAFWMMWARTRHVAMLFCALFHLMNSRLFRIGMFPWVCLATMPLFYPFDWPKVVASYLREVYYITKRKLCECTNLIRSGTIACKNKGKENINKKEKLENEDVREKWCINNEPDKEDSLEDLGDPSCALTNDNTDHTDNITKETTSKEEIDDSKQKFTCILISIYIFTQAFLPFSHFITKGYNNWTNGLYGYSWDMMVHTWDVHSVVVKVVDNERNSGFYVDPYHFTPNERWTRHGDMVFQYARCLKENMVKESTRRTKFDDSRKSFSENISVYVDVWCSLNGRFTQRMFDPKVDVLAVTWSPFAPISFLMPLLDEASEWRGRLLKLRETIHSWNNYSDVIFIADFPGYEYEKYIPTELRNVTLTILDGLVVYEPELSRHQIGKSYQLRTGEAINIQSGIFQKVLNIGKKPAFYMYTFFNSSELNNGSVRQPVPKLPVGRELLRRFNNMALFAKNIMTSLFQLFFNMSKCQQP